MNGNHIAATQGRRAVTLIELLVAMAVFLVLGVALVGLLMRGLRTWREGESERQLYEKARIVLEKITDDIRCCYTHPTRLDMPCDVRLLCDRDVNGAQRLRFVRTIAAPDYAASEAGSLIGADSELDLVEDRREAREGRLKPTEGLCEVAYAIDPDPTKGVLYRGIRSPIGGSDSLFDDSNLRFTSDDAPTMFEIADPVLYLEFRFWSPCTNTWDARHFCLRNPRSGRESGPLLFWDSTRRIQPDDELDERCWTTYKHNTEAGAYSDDVFPRAVRILLTLGKRAGAGRVARTTKAVSAEELHIPVEGVSHLGAASGYVRLEQEWVYFEEIRGNCLVVPEDGRGGRATLPAAHRRGVPVRSGRQFVTTVSLPSYREDWNER